MADLTIGQLNKAEVSSLAYTKTKEEAVNVTVGNIWAEAYVEPKNSELVAILGKPLTENYKKDGSDIINGLAKGHNDNSEPLIGTVSKQVNFNTTEAKVAQEAVSATKAK